MERRDFLRTLSGAGLLSMLDPAYLSAKERLQSGKSPADTVPKRRYGRAEDMISVIGFGGIVVKDVTPEETSNQVSEAVDRGIEFRMIEPEVVEHAPHVEVLPRVRPGEVRGLEEINVFIAITEKEAAALAFPETEGDFDYLGFTSRDEGTLKWCKELFLYYWDKARPKLE